MPDRAADASEPIDVDELWSAVQLQNVLPYRLEYISRMGGFDDLPDPREADGAFDVETHVMASDQDEAVIVRVQAQVSGEAFVVNADNGALYGKPATRPLTKEAQRALVHQGVMAIYPYLREQVASLTARRGHQVLLGVLEATRLQIGDPE